MYTLEQQEDADSQVREIGIRHLSPKLLILGAILGSLGVVFTVTNSLLVFYGDLTNPLGEPYESGNGYWPLTVSEAVSKQDSASSQVFFAFCLLGGLSIFTSFYPFQLRNCYTGTASVCGTCFRWTTIRQILPPTGLILLAIVPMKSAPLATFTDKVALVLHGVGAGLAFGGYLLCEVFALCILKESVMDSTEKFARAATCVIFILCFSVFGVCYSIDKVNTAMEKPFMCCLDKWEEAEYKVSLSLRGNTVEQDGIRQKTYLWDTASGTVLVFKLLGYFGEVLAFTAMMVNMILIWYFCDERLSRESERPLATVSAISDDEEEDGTDADQ